MKIQNKRIVIILAVVFLTGIVLFWIGQRPEKINMESAFTRESSFRGKYIFSSEPKLNIETQLTFSVSPIMDASNVDVRLLFSNGVELINENLDEGGGGQF